MSIINDVTSIAESLDKYGDLYSTFWNIVSFLESDSIETAGIMFSKVGDPVSLVINPNFWTSLSTDEKEFILLHECLHVLFFHGYRAMCRDSNNTNLNYRLLNIATDICINHYIESSLKFDRHKLSKWQTYCWIETVFKNPQTVDKNRDFQYYYDMLMYVNKSSLQHIDTVDCHDSLKNAAESSDIASHVNGILDEVFDKSSTLGKDSKSLEDLKDNKNFKFGNQSSSKSIDIFASAVKHTYWHKILKGTRQTNKNSAIQDIDFVTSWIKENRRTTELDDTFLLPRDVDDLIDIMPARLAMYIDISGSCVQYVKPFVEIVKSVPYRKFKFKAYSFDTRVNEIDYRPDIIRIRGGGGTSLSCVVRHANADPFNPSMIIVVTDGEGDLSVTPNNPNIYHWFLTHWNTESYIRRIFSNPNVFKLPIFKP